MGFKSVSLVLAVCLAPILMVAGEARAAETDSPNTAAEVVSVQGDGQFRVEDRDSWKDAEVEQDLFAGNFVRTGDYSRMGLLFSDRTQIRLNEKTLIQIKQARHH